LLSRLSCNSRFCWMHSLLFLFSLFLCISYQIQFVILTVGLWDIVLINGDCNAVQKHWIFEISMMRMSSSS
jgi:hypothetical protein